ncbi:NAD(P)-dependent alcohol dehydrogenase [Terriglobus albidus]|uniref:NAD(P)-dependent alcohol dehydrogenase n=1 Tax=Terriglobus albidus TaxID=1592106 RepID=A0A5B9EDF0_9BACT|nr:NAD(P)-dependent alcohol dehydrogenase [Terriglobus albidus]QEE30213.1 NAD(P)-dependent alcohol dehydrogenase [Terriglobus albidus]
MKAWKLHHFGIDGLQRVDEAIPRPSAKQILVRVGSVSLNYRDKLLIAGTYNPRMPIPIVPLSDAAGVVVEIGSEVRRAKVGDRIMTHYATRWLDGEPAEDRSLHTLGNTISGALAEYILVDEQAFVAIPEYLTDDQAATLPVAALSAWYALVEMAQLEKSQSVVIQGTGGVSLFGLQFAVALGARVIATSSSDRKVELVRALGASAVINYVRSPDWETEALALTEGKGVDHVLEVVGGQNLTRSIKAIRPGGQISTIGMLEASSSTLDLFALIRKAAVIRGIGGAGHRRAFEKMTQALSRFRIKPIIDAVYPFEEARAAIEHLERGPFGKVVIRVATD